MTPQFFCVVVLALAIVCTQRTCQCFEPMLRQHIVRASAFTHKQIISSKSTKLHMNMESDKFPELIRCISKEYATFFNPLDRRFYADDVAFIDPLTTFIGLDKYKQNVDMLAGRSGVGRFMFEDASIALHKVEILGENKFQTRWTLQVTVKSLPWKPRARFTGISVYTLTPNLQKIQKQEDFWDSVNLLNGQYRSRSFQEGLNDFLSQLKKEQSASMNAPELPYELLRRAKYYEIRRYPAFVAAQTSYDKRPEGYDRLGSFVSGSNEANSKVSYFAPTLMRIDDDPTILRSKTMTWPLQYTLPGKADSSTKTVPTIPAPTIPKVQIVPETSKVVAVLRFEAAATEEVARRCTNDLITCLKNDGIVPVSEASNGQRVIVGQFDALFSLNKRRIEVWVELDKHPWL